MIIAQGVSFAGVEVAVGTELELSEISAASLIESGHAEGGEEVKTFNPNAGANDPTEEEKQTEALNAQYKRDELYAAAKEVGVDLAYDATKPVIIAAVIAQGFAAALIK
ncbi:hypothetical protein [Paenibacillus sinopodophylli]|uniref:hypothetical protein n=1 Tax=Paenibacillus sinopodophylli TaxID=1837342 RepID=UPI00110D0E26|nr:hypothetical protein [Paenibacillus sinopodophylli]